MRSNQAKTSEVKAMTSSESKDDKTPTADAILGMIDHALLHPTLTDAQIRAELEVLRKHKLASVCIKPYWVSMCAKFLADTGIATGTVIGFPHGSPVPGIKAAEARQAFADGAQDVDMVVNVGKVLSGDWAFVRDDVRSVLEVTRERGGVIKVIFETDYLDQGGGNGGGKGDADKIRLCEICSEMGVDFVKTSTGFGFVKQADGGFATHGARDADLILMRRHCPPSVGVKASGGIRSLDDVLRVIKLGVTRIGTSSTLAIYKSAVEKVGESAVIAESTVGSLGY
jgi:deoxyribose-phosphate aldolase